MALKVFDGFDHYNATADILARSGFLQWQMPHLSKPTLSLVTAANGIGKALKVTNSSGSVLGVLRGVLADRNDEAYFGQRVLIPSGTVGEVSKLTLILYDTIADAPQISIVFNPINYTIQIFRGSNIGTSLYLSGNNAWAGDVHNFIEIGAVIANSGGSAEVRVNGVTLATVSSVDTQATANAWYDAVDYLIEGVLNPFIYLDDFRYNDAATDPGTFPNDSFIGDAGTRTLFAIGQGTVQFTPNSGANNYSRVNEVAMDSDTSYNSSATPGDEDQLTFSPIINAIVVVLAVQITIAARKDDVGPRVIKTGVTSGSTTDYGANHSVPDSYAYFTDIWVLNPDTTANWTRTEVNGVTVLYNLVS